MNKLLFAAAVVIGAICAAAGVPIDFVLFALTLVGVALFHERVLYVALTGLAVIVLYKLVFTGFKFGTGLAGLALHMQHEWVILANLFLMAGLGLENWLRLFIWLAIGLCIYFGYSRRHSLLRRSPTRTGER